MSQIESLQHKIRERLEIFASSFDTKAWDEMKDCLAENIIIDYSSFTKRPKSEITREEYVLQKKAGTGHLVTNHKLFDFKIIPYHNKINCKCKFLIKRFETKTGKYFHSSGTYDFTLANLKNNWRIENIVQTVSKVEGNPEIHGIMKK